MTKEELIEHLGETFEELKAQQAAVMKRAEFEGINPYRMLHVDGTPAMQSILTAKAQVLSALVAIEL